MTEVAVKNNFLKDRIKTLINKEIVFQSIYSKIKEFLRVKLTYVSKISWKSQFIFEMYS